jgi:hypothetical protein
MHETSIHVSLKEIRGETHSNLRNHTENKGTKNKHGKEHLGSITFSDMLKLIPARREFTS